MFHVIEKHRRLAQILLALIAVTFVGFGVGSLAAHGDDYLVKVGDAKVTSYELDDAVRRLRAAGSPDVSRDVALASLVERAYLQQGGADLGAATSLEEVKRMIATESAFQTNGVFSTSKYQAFLASSHISEADLVRDIRNQLAVRAVLNLLQSSLIVSHEEAKQWAELLKGAKNVALATTLPAHFVNEIKVDDAALQTYYREHGANYQQSREVKFSYVALSAKDLAAKQKVSDETIEKAYEALPAGSDGKKEPFSKASSKVKDKLKQELALNMAKRELPALRERLADVTFNHPKDLQAVAKELNLTLQHSNKWLSESATGVYPEGVTQALFSDDVFINRNNSEPIALDSDTVWVVHVDEAKEARALTFDEVKNRVRDDFVLDEARKLALAAAKKELAELERGEKPSTNYFQFQAPHRVTLLEAATLLTPEDFNAFLKATPKDGGSAYVLLSENVTPTIMKITRAAPEAVSTEDIAAAADDLKNRKADQWLQAYLNSLRERYPAKQGVQAVSHH